MCDPESANRARCNGARHVMTVPSTTDEVKLIARKANSERCSGEFVVKKYFRSQSATGPRSISQRESGRHTPITPVTSLNVARF